MFLITPKRKVVNASKQNPKSIVFFIPNLLESKLLNGEKINYASANDTIINEMSISFK